MRIAELSKMTKTSTRSLRHYEKTNLLKPVRLKNGYREFAKSDVERVRKIVLMLELGFSLKFIKQLEPCLALEKHDLKYCQRTEAALAKHKKTLQTKAEKIKQLIKDIDSILRR